MVGTFVVVTAQWVVWRRFFIYYAKLFINQFNQNPKIMKKLFALALVVLGLAACQTEPEGLDVNVGGEVETLINVSVPESATRAAAGTNSAEGVFKNGVLASDDYTMRYILQIYTADGNPSNERLVAHSDDKSVVFPVRLIAGRDYKFVVWADVVESEDDTDLHYNTADLKNITLNDTWKAMDETRDAFTASVDVEDYSKSSSLNITLYRPFAKLRIVTTDIQAVRNLNVEPTTATVTYTTAYREAFNAYESKANTAGTSKKEHKSYEIKSYGETGAELTLFTDYFFAEQDIVKFDFAAYDQNGDLIAEESFGTDIPVERNYLTTLKGSILTDASNVTVTVSDPFAGERVNPELTTIADGVSYDEETKTFFITNVNGLKWFATQTDGITRSTDTVDTKNGTFDGLTVQLMANIDLENKPWTPIASTGTFLGTFNGNDYTISNLKVEVTDKTPAGLFANARCVKNLKLQNVDINGYYKSGAIVGDGLCARIENCHVDGGSIVIKPLNQDDGNHAGGIVGYLSAEPEAYVKNCSVKNLSIVGYRDVGGIVGTANGASHSPVVEGNSVECTDIVANQLDDYKEEKDANVGEIVGRNIKGIDLAANEIKDDVYTDVLEYIDTSKPTIELSCATSFNILGEMVTAGNTMAGKTLKLTGDIKLNKPTHTNSTSPLGDNAVFEGTLDGDGHTISDLYQSGWDFGYEWGSYGSLGLFSELNNATVKNVVIENMDACVEGGDISFIAGSATGDCVFENITIKDSSIGTYNNGCGGIIGWSGAGNYTFKNIKIDSDVVLGGLWGSFDSSIGGIVGQAEPGATYNFENVEINCRIDAYNDCTASYDYYNYRMCGMIIGRCEETTTINGVNYPDITKYNLSFNNVVVNYGDWMNYHYCRAAGARGKRVEPGYAYDGISEDYDHNNCTVYHMECIPFDQLIGGDQYGVKGLREVMGVTVNYPKSFQKQVATKADFENEIKKGGTVVLGADIDMGTTQLAINNAVVDLNGKTLTTNMTSGGISVKNGGSIKNGTIEHKSTVAAIKAFDVEAIENVKIKTTCATANKTVTAIAVQQGGKVGSIKNVTIEGVSQGIEVGYQATVGTIEDVTVTMNANGTAEGIGLVINGGKVGKATNCVFEGDNYGVKMLLKGVFDVALELAGCTATGATASIAAYDEKGLSNTSGSLTLTYDAATTLNGPFVWDFEDECKSVVTLNKPN